MSLFKSFGISGSGMTAERLRLDLISNNIANAHTTRTTEGGPYRREVPVFAQYLERFRGRGFAGAGVRVTAVVKDPSPLRAVHEPEHPDADAAGFVQYPNVDLNREFVDLMGASRAYEANAAALDAAKQMVQRALELGRG
ncbi:MAG: flagellar basal body rod protein FlgC [Bacillota bacterium]